MTVPNDLPVYRYAPTVNDADPMFEDGVIRGRVVLWDGRTGQVYASGPAVVVAMDGEVFITPNPEEGTHHE